MIINERMFACNFKFLRFSETDDGFLRPKSFVTLVFNIFSKYLTDFVKVPIVPPCGLRQSAICSVATSLPPSTLSLNFTETF